MLLANPLPGYRLTVIKRRNLRICTRFQLVMLTAEVVFVLLGKVFSYNWYPAAHTKSLATDTNNWTELVSFIFIGINQF